MNNEDIEIKEVCIAIMDEVTASEDELERTIANCDLYESDHCRNRLIKRKLSKVALVAIVAICSVILLSGVLVYAFYHDAISEYFFGKDGNKITEIYNREDKVYSFGRNKIVLHGTICDNATGVVYLSFEIEDLDGCTLEDEIKVSPLSFLGQIDAEMQRHLSLLNCKIGNDDCYIIFSNCDGFQCRIVKNMFFVKCYINQNAIKDDKYFGCLVLDRVGFQSLLDEYSSLDVNEILYAGNERYYEFSVENQFFDIKQVQPEMMELLEKHGLERIKQDNLTVKYVDVDSASVVFGKTDCYVKYNMNDNIESITLIREDGTELQIIKNGELVNNGQYAYGGVDKKSGDVYYQYGYGFVLDDQEKIIIKINDSVIR